MPQTPILSGESRLRSTAALPAGAVPTGCLRHESDEALVALTRAGSERAFAEITRRYQRPLQWYCARLVGAERAQDAVQQALLQAFLSLRDRAPREIALRPWLYRIAHNCSIDLLRMGSWEYEQLDVESDGVPQPPAVVEQKEELRGLIAHMRRLPEAQRRALTLRELEGCSYEEISARLGHTGSGVRQLIFRARSALRKGASALAPFVMVRERIVGMAPAVESHHVAGVAAVPASSGSGMETVGAAALAVVAVLGGVAGGVRTGQHPRAADAKAHAAAPAARPAPLAATRSLPADAWRPGRRVTRPRADAGEAPAAVLERTAAPVIPPPAVPAVPAPPVPAPPAEPALPAPEPVDTPVPPPGEEGTAVEQQSLPLPGRDQADSSPGTGQPAAGAPGTTPTAPSAPAQPQPAQPQAGASRRTRASAPRRVNGSRRPVWRAAARR